MVAVVVEEENNLTGDRVSPDSSVADDPTLDETNDAKENQAEDLVLCGDTLEKIDRDANKSLGAHAAAEWRVDLRETDNHILELLDEELRRVDDFYYSLIDEAKSRQADVVKNMTLYMKRSAGEQKKARKTVERMLFDQDTFIDLVVSYRILNFTAFQKILKKYDKYLEASLSDPYLQCLSIGHFYEPSILPEMLEEIQQVYADAFMHGHLSGARARMRHKARELPFKTRTFFQMGLFVGGSIVSSVSVLFHYRDHIISLLVGLYNGDDTFAPFFPVLRLPLLASIYFLLLGTNLQVFEMFKINFFFIMGTQKQERWRFFHMYELFSVYLLFFAVALACYFGSFNVGLSDGTGRNLLFTIPVVDVSLYWHPLIVPLIIVWVSIFYFFDPNPRRVSYRRRRYALRSSLEASQAPFRFVTFSQFWLMDQFTSLLLIWFDLYTVTCLSFVEVPLALFFPEESQGICHNSNIFVRPFIAALPSICRLLQCLRRFRDSKYTAWNPHMTNGLKYLSSIVAIYVTGIFYGTRYVTSHVIAVPLWLTYVVASGLLVMIVVVTIRTIYVLYWDLWKDWSVFGRKGSSNFPLRDKLIFPKWTYYCGIVEDALIRFTWIYSIFAITGILEPLGTITETIFGTLEVVRRGVWNFFRVENEHLNNCGQFRAVQEVPIPFDEELNPDTFVDDDALPVAAAMSFDSRSHHSSKVALEMTRGDVSPQHFHHARASSSIASSLHKDPLVEHDATLPSGEVVLTDVGVTLAKDEPEPAGDHVTLPPIETN